MKTMFLLLIAAFLIAAFCIIVIPEKSTINISHNIILTSAEAQDDPSVLEKNKEDSIIPELDKKYQQKIKYAIIIIFAVLFVAGMYWWTYGRLHHKLPRY